MACAEFEDLLADYAELSGESRLRVDAHAATCADCQEFLDALHAVDATLAAQFAGREVSAGFGQAVRRRVQRKTAVRRPSFIPELLDFVGWSAIIAVIAFTLYWASALIPISNEAAKAFNANAGWAVAAAFLLVSFLIGLHSFVELKY